MSEREEKQDELMLKLDTTWLDENQYLGREIIIGGHKITASLVNTDGDFYIEIDNKPVMYFDAPQDKIGVLSEASVEPIEKLMRKYKR